MMGAGALTLREVARRVERDLAAVQWDLHALLDAGVLERTGAGLSCSRMTRCTSILR
jgi:predicted transcriptional regulator